MKIFKKTNSKIEDLKLYKRTPSTLLLPNSILNPFLKRRLQRYKGNTTVYLRNLLKLYRSLNYADLFPPPAKVKSEYQEENLDLKRITFRPNNSDWIELGSLALAFGKSRCWIFTYLVELDLSGFTEILSTFLPSPSVPTTPDLELKSLWTLEPYYDSFTRSLHVIV